MASYPRANRISLIGWLSLLWVWSSLGWLVVGLAVWSDQALAVSAVIALRLLFHLAVGVGLCAGERWGWAWAVCACVLGTLTAGAVAVTSATAWLLVPADALSWKPVYLGLVPAQVIPVALGSLLTTVVCGLILCLLLREQRQFEIPHRRSFTLLLRYGLAPSLLAWIGDGFLLACWWRSLLR